MKKIKTKIYNFLKWTEKWTKTDMIYFVYGNFWLTIGRFISLLVGSLLTIAFANLIPPETLGNYKYILSLTSLLSILSLSGIGTSVAKTISEGYDGIIKHANKICFNWSLITSFLSIIASILFFLKNKNSIAYVLIIYAFAAPILKIGSMSIPLLSAKKEFKRSTIYSTYRTIISTTLLITILFFTNNLIIIAGSYFLINAVLSLTTYLVSIKKVNVKLNKINKKKEKETLVYAKHLSVIGIFIQVSEEIDKLLLFHFAGPAQLAIYSFAYAPIKEIKNIIDNVSPLAFPKFAQKRFEDVKKGLPLRAIQMTLFIIPLLILYLITAPFIFKLFFPAYTKSIFYSQILSIILLFQPSVFIETALSAHAKIKQKYFITIFTSITKITFLTILIPLYGIHGIIFSIIFSEIIKYIILIFFILN